MGGVDVFIWNWLEVTLMLGNPLCCVYYQMVAQTQPFVDKQLHITSVKISVGLVVPISLIYLLSGAESFLSS